MEVKTETGLYFNYIVQIKCLGSQVWPEGRSFPITELFTELFLLFTMHNLTTLHFKLQ